MAGRRTPVGARPPNNWMDEAERTGGATDRAMEGMAQSIQRIDASTSSISKVIRVIDEIAFQTKIFLP